MSHTQPEMFHPQAKHALADKELRQNFRGAMDYLRHKRKDAFPDADEEKAVRDLAEAIRQRCLSKLIKSSRISPRRKMLTCSSKENPW